MKGKILSILSVVMFIFCTSVMTPACSKQQKKSQQKLHNKNVKINDDANVLNELTIDTRKKIYDRFITNETSVIEMNNSKLYDDVSSSSSNVNLRNGLEKDVVNQMVNDVCKDINKEIVNNYYNHYLDSNPLDIKDDSSEIIVSYINPEAYSINNNIVVNTKEVKAVSIKYNLVVDLKYKNMKNTIKLELPFIITNNKNFITNKISDYVNLLKNEIKKFNKERNSEILLCNKINDNNDSFKTSNFWGDMYNSLSFLDFYGFFDEVDKGIKNEFKLFLDNNVPLNDSDSNKLFFSFNPNIKFVEPKFVNSSDERIKFYDYFMYNKIRSDSNSLSRNHLSCWLFDGNYVLKNNSSDFVSFYYNKRGDQDKKIKLGVFEFNLNCFSVSGLPLISGLLKNEELSVYLTSEGLKDKLDEFGNLIYKFLRFFDVKLNTDNTATLYVNSKVFKEIEEKAVLNKSIADIVEIINNNFKSINSNMNNIEYFDFIFLKKDLKNDLIIIDDYDEESNNYHDYEIKNDKQIFIGGNNNIKVNWVAGFVYGSGENIYYVPKISYMPFGKLLKKANFYIESK